MKVQADAAAGGDRDLAQPEFTASQGGEVWPERLASQPFHLQHPLGHGDLLALIKPLMGWHHRRLGMARTRSAAGNQKQHPGPTDQ